MLKDLLNSSARPPALLLPTVQAAHCILQSVSALGRVGRESRRRRRQAVTRVTVGGDPAPLVLVGAIGETPAR